MFSFHPDKSGRYHNFGYGKTLWYDTDSSDYHCIYGIKIKIKKPYLTSLIM